MPQTGQVVWYESPANRLQTVVAFSTELGWMACRWEADLVDAVTFGNKTANQALLRLSGSWTRTTAYEPTDEQTLLIERLTAFAEGTPDDFHDVQLNTASMTPFQKRVVTCCRRIPWGRKLSYGELAKEAGRPGAARAVGTVMSHNRFPLIVPCHRVVGSQGALGGFSAPDGLQMKCRLLEREGALDPGTANRATAHRKPR